VFLGGTTGSNSSIAPSSNMLKSVSSPLLARSAIGGYLASKGFHDHGKTVSRYS
jgi:hypothetical protein